MGLDLQRHEILNSKIALTPLQYQILSGNCPFHIIPSLSKSRQYTRIHIQASMLSILCHDRHLPWGTLIFATVPSATVPCSSLYDHHLYDHPLWWTSIIITENKPEPSNLHGIVLRLGEFHTLINLLEVVDCIMTGKSDSSLLALTYAENTVTHI